MELRTPPGVLFCVRDINAQVSVHFGDLGREHAVGAPNFFIIYQYPLIPVVNQSGGINLLLSGRILQPLLEPIFEKERNTPGGAEVSNNCVFGGLGHHEEIRCINDWWTPSSYFRDLGGQYRLVGAGALPHACQNRAQYESVSGMLEKPINHHQFHGRFPDHSSAADTSAEAGPRPCRSFH